MKNTDGYKMAMGEKKGNGSKRSGVMNYLKTLVIEIKGNTYRVRNINEPWAELKKTTYYKSIVICF